MSKLRSVFSSLDLIYPKNSVTSNITKVIQKFPEIEEQLFDAYSLGQVKSKLWLIEHLPNNLGKIFICAGWYGTLANLMFEKCPEKFKNIRSFDIDPSCEFVADELNRSYVIDNWKFKAATMDILNMQYPTKFKTFKSDGTIKEIKEIPDTIINTSCEHIIDFNRWYDQLPSGKTIVLQTNDYFSHNTHINCSNSLSEFAQQTPMSRIIYEGELDLVKYKRFMRIGIK